MLGLVMCALLFLLFGVMPLLGDALRWIVDIATPAGRARRRAAAELRQAGLENERQRREEEPARRMRERADSRQRAYEEWQPRYDALMGALVSDWIDDNDPNLELDEVPDSVLDEMGRQVEGRTGPDPRWQ